MAAHSLSLGLYDFYTALRLLQPRSPEAGTGPISAATRGGVRLDQRLPSPELEAV